MVEDSFLVSPPGFEGFYRGFPHDEIMHAALETPAIGIRAILEETGPEDEPLGGGGNCNGRLGKVLV